MQDQGRKFLTAVECKIKDENFLQLEESSRDVPSHIEGYMSFKAKESFSNCCGDNLLTVDGDQKNLGSLATRRPANSSRRAF